MSKKVSIITVTYNAADTLGATIQSVLDQTYTNIEFIIIDGNSSDGTVEIIKGFNSRLAFWSSEKDRGIYDAMNKGIAAATGDWIYFLGADDVLINNTVLAEIQESLNSEEVDFLYGNVKLKSNNVTMGGSRSYRELIGRNISHQAIFYKTDIIKQKGFYNLKYKILADYDLNLRIFADSTIIKD
jgi:glycosyltransferase involved in cell wall biosynthesis